MALQRGGTSIQSLAKVPNVWAQNCSSRCPVICALRFCPFEQLRIAGQECLSQVGPRRQGPICYHQSPLHHMLPAGGLGLCPPRSSCSCCEWLLLMGLAEDALGQKKAACSLAHPKTASFSVCNKWALGFSASGLENSSMTE